MKFNFIAAFYDRANRFKFLRDLTAPDVAFEVVSATDSTPTGIQFRGEGAVYHYVSSVATTPLFRECAGDCECLAGRRLRAEQIAPKGAEEA